MSPLLALLALCLAGVALADHGGGGHHHPSPAAGGGGAAAAAAGPVPQVKYGGPIVYSGEKPPIIHFPPPPPPVSFAEEVLQILRIFPPKDDLNPPLPELSPMYKSLRFKCSEVSYISMQKEHSHNISVNH